MHKIKILLNKSSNRARLTGHSINKVNSGPFHPKSPGVFNILGKNAGATLEPLPFLFLIGLAQIAKQTTEGLSGPLRVLVPWAVALFPKPAGHLFYKLKNKCYSHRDE